MSQQRSAARHPLFGALRAGRGRPLAAIVGLAAALCLATPAALSAQFTAAITPPPTPTAPSVVAAAESSVVARRDSVRTADRLDMRAWVDSAARALQSGQPPVEPVPVTPGDSAVPPAAATPPAPATPPARSGRRGDTTWRPGAAAPDTATPLPALLALGAALFGGGLALLASRRRSA